MKILAYALIAIAFVQCADARPRGTPLVFFPVPPTILLRAQDIAQADGSAVATWNDTSGNGFNLTQATGTAQPMLVLTGGNNGLPFVAFGSVHFDTMTNASFAYDKRAGSLFCVIDYLTVSSAKYTVSLDGGNWVLMHGPGDFIKAAPSQVAFSSLTPIPSGRPVAFILTSGTGGVKLYVDASTNVQTVAADTAGSVSGFTFGGSGPLLGKVYECRSWARELSIGDVSTILDVLAPAAYGTGAAATTPAGRVVFDGDSITMGTGATKSRNWPYFLNPGNGWLGYNYAQSGNTWANLSARQAITNTFAAAGNWLIVNAGANDVAGGQTAVQMETSFSTYMNAAIAAGFSKSKMVATTLSTTNLGAGGTARNDFNTWLRANYTTYAGFLFDLQADVDLGSSLAGSQNNSSYWTDGVHYNDAGYQLYATKIRALTSAPF